MADDLPRRGLDRIGEPARAQRCGVVEDDVLVLARVEREDAQLEYAPLVPLEQGRIAHLVFDLLEDLLRLLALDELAAHHLSVDLHREAEQDRAVGQREPERALRARLHPAVEDVVDLGVDEVALDVGVDLDRFERDGPGLPVRVRNLEGAHGGGGRSLDRGGELRVRRGARRDRRRRRGARSARREDSGKKGEAFHRTWILPTVTV